MFENLTDSLTNFFNRIRGKGRKLTEADVREGLRTVRLALLEADVALPVVKEFISKVEAKAVGQEVLQSLDPSQMLVKVVHGELQELLGNQQEQLQFAPSGPTVFMLAGLQGSGKTTLAGKLALRFKSKGRRPLLVAADLQRPAAVEQLKVLGEELEVPVFTQTAARPPEVCALSLDYAKQQGRDLVILDTAGRLHIDELLMMELEQIRHRAQPHEVLLVLDAMVGQDAVNSAREFNARLPVTGIILTKLDGDARGGAALSVRHVTGKPIKLVSVGEKLDRLEEFHPARMATRILGMGDVLTLIEKAQQAVGREESLKFQQKMLRDTLSLDDFLSQIRKVKKMGSFKDLIALIPGFSQLKDLDAGDEQFAMAEAIISSMTREERRNPAIIGASRRRRIAAGAGVAVNEVSRMLKQFEEITKQLSSFARAGQLMDRMLPGTGAKPRLLSEEERRELRRRRKLERQRRREGRK